MPGIISLDNVTVRFPIHDGGEHCVFAGLSLDIEPGELVSIVGQTGCGKSTLLKLLLGSERPTNGEVLVEGRPVRQPSRDRGYVPQKYSLFPDKTVLQNIAFGPMLDAFRWYGPISPAWWRNRREIYQHSGHYLRRVGLLDRDGKKYPDQLSGGMQQRVAIAQSLIMMPKILLMDEAFSALDSKTRADMQRLLRSIWQETGTTLIFVTHNLAEAVYLSSRIILLCRDHDAECSRVALDLRVPDYIRRPDGHPHRDELERIIHQIESVASGGQVEQEVAAFDS